MFHVFDFCKIYNLIVWSFSTPLVLSPGNPWQCRYSGQKVLQSCYSNVWTALLLPLRMTLYFSKKMKENFEKASSEFCYRVVRVAASSFQLYRTNMIVLTGKKFSMIPSFHWFNFCEFHRESEQFRQVWYHYCCFQCSNGRSAVEYSVFHLLLKAKILCYRCS